MLPLGHLRHGSLATDNARLGTSATPASLPYTLRLRSGARSIQLVLRSRALAPLVIYRRHLPAVFMGAKRELVLLSSWGLGIPLLAYFISFAMPILLPRYFLFSSLALFMLLTYLASLVPVSTPARCLLLAALVAPTALAANQTPIIRPDWRSAVERVVHYWPLSDSLLVVSPPWEEIPFSYYYSRTSAEGLAGTSREGSPVADTAIFTVDLADAVATRVPAHINTLVVIGHEQAPLILENANGCRFRERRREALSQLTLHYDRDCQA